jgi:hypothetical protein
MNTIDVLEEIINVNKISAITVKDFPKQQLLQDRLVFNEIEKVQYNKAVEIRGKYNLPFWDSILLTFFNNKECSYRILESANCHNHLLSEHIFSTPEQIRQYILKSPEKNFAINSKVRTENGDIRHMQLLDFHIPINDLSLPHVRKTLYLLKINDGYILNSGESYHFIGTKLMNDLEQVEFLANALLFSPIIDRAWIAHQLIEKSSSLRLGNKHGSQPILIEKFNER